MDLYPRVGAVQAGRIPASRCSQDLEGDLMKKAMFRYKMALAGYTDEEIENVEQWIEKCVISSVRSHAREAVLTYAVICTDLSMVPTFLHLVDRLYLESSLEYQESARWVAHIIAGWCK